MYKIWYNNSEFFYIYLESVYNLGWRNPKSWQEKSVSLLWAEWKLRRSAWQENCKLLMGCCKLKQLIGSVPWLLYLKTPQHIEQKEPNLFPSLEVGLQDLPWHLLNRLHERDVLSCFAGYHSCFFPLRTIWAKTISLWQSEFVILSNHLGCLQNFSRWQRFVDKCFVIQVISFSATVAILINWTYDCICQDWKYCHPIWHLLLSELTTTSIVFIKGESLCVYIC